MSENTLVNEAATDAQGVETQNQAQADKTYSQQEVNDMMARMKGSLEKKLLKPYQDLGDPDELRNIKTDYEKRQQAEQIKRGEFEKTLQEMAARKDEEIRKRDEIIRDYRVNTPLLNAAAQYRAVAPEQVKSLLVSNVRMNDQGEVEVVDSKGSVRYNDRGEPLGVSDLVREFLDSNPHFVQAGTATVNTKTSVAGRADKLDVSKLDMNNPEHRALYKEYRKANGLR